MAQHIRLSAWWSSPLAKRTTDFYSFASVSQRQCFGGANHDGARALVCTTSIVLWIAWPAPWRNTALEFSSRSIAVPNDEPRESKPAGSDVDGVCCGVIRRRSGSCQRSAQADRHFLGHFLWRTATIPHRRPMCLVIYLARYTQLRCSAATVKSRAIRMPLLQSEVVVCKHKAASEAKCGCGLCHVDQCLRS